MQSDLRPATRSFTSASSWTATADGRRGAACRALRGHEAGVEAIRRIVEAAPKQGIGTLTLYAFSTDNWRRPKTEVAALMTLLRFYLANEVQSLVKNGVRLTVIGRRDRLPDGIAMRSRARKMPPRTAARFICASPSTIPRATPSSTPQRRRRR